VVDTFESVVVPRVALEVALRIAAQVVIEIAAGVFVRFNWEVAGQVLVALLPRIGHRIGVPTTMHIVRAIGLKIDLRMPCGVAFRTTSRTVPGTVSKVVPRIAT
jgi:hypothetical protein